MLSGALTLESVSCRNSVTQKNDTVDAINTDGCDAIENKSCNKLDSGVRETCLFIQTFSFRSIMR